MMKQVALPDLRNDLSGYLHLAANEEIVITEDGKPTGILVGFASDDDWIEYQLEHDPRFLKRVAQARQSLREGNGVRLEDL